MNGGNRATNRNLGVHTLFTALFFLFYPGAGRHHHHNIIDQKDCTILVISGQFVGVRTVKLVVSSACSSYCAFSSTESYIHSVGEIFLSDYQEVMIAHGKLQDLSASHYVKLGLGNYVGWCTLGILFFFWISKFLKH